MADEWLTDDAAVREKTDERLNAIANRLPSHFEEEEKNEWKWYELSIPQIQARKLLADRIEKP